MRLECIVVEEGTDALRNRNRLSVNGVFGVMTDIDHGVDDVGRKDEYLMLEDRVHTILGRQAVEVDTGLPIFYAMPYIKVLISMRIFLLL